MVSDVKNQGELLDNIEVNVEEAKENAVNADKEIKQGQNTNNKNFCNKILLILFILIIVVGIVVTLVLTL
jgi:t-SNARE complex subunit (syntaxin)